MQGFGGRTQAPIAESAGLRLLPPPDGLCQTGIDMKADRPSFPIFYGEALILNYLGSDGDMVHSLDVIPSGELGKVSIRRAESKQPSP